MLACFSCRAHQTQSSRSSASDRRSRQTQSSSSSDSVVVLVRLSHHPRQNQIVVLIRLSHHPRQTQSSFSSDSVIVLGIQIVILLHECRVVDLLPTSATTARDDQTRVDLIAAAKPGVKNNTLNERCQSVSLSQVGLVGSVSQSVYLVV
jgi:hypothetical protein